MQSWHTTYLGLRELPREISTFELQSFFTYSRTERELINARRSNAHKLGLALHIGFLRLSGRLLNSVRIVPTRLCRSKPPKDNQGMAPLHLQLANSTLRRVIKRLHFPLEIMLVCVRWYAAYPLSLRNLEEMMAERGVTVDHATVHRWALKILPVLTAVFRTRKRSVDGSWRVDETYILVGGQWKYLYRAVDRMGLTVDFLLTARRDEAAARRFFEQAINLHDAPEKITIDKSGANTAAVRALIADSGLAIELRQSKYLNNVVEQDHRAIKRRIRPMMGFKSFWAARRILAGVETMHMLRKGQMSCPKGVVTPAAQQFYSLAI